MLTWHTDNLENKNVALDFKKVADPWFRSYNWRAVGHMRPPLSLSAACSLILEYYILLTSAVQF